MVKVLYVYMNALRFLFQYLYYRHASNKYIIEQDLCRNLHLFYKTESITFYNFCRLLLFYKMYRNIFYARIASNHLFLAKFFSILASPLPLLDISSTADIGGGLIIQHGYGTIIDPRSIGQNLWVNQGVTIGYTNDTDCPIIGDNVTVGAGAKILGNITIGDNVIIGANCVVVKNVPDNCTVVGVPARIVKLNNEKVDIRL